MKKGPTHDDRASRADSIEARRYTVKHETLEPPSSVVLWIDCPFCHQEVKAYKWSISGGGKRCKCGAMLTRLGNAYHWKKDSHPKMPAEKAKIARDKLRKKAISCDKKQRHADSAFLRMCASFAEKIRQQEEDSRNNGGRN